MAYIKKTKTYENSLNKKPKGRPTKYLPVYAKQAKKLAIQGLNEKQIYDFLEIAEKNGIAWKKKYPEFCKSLEEGKAEPIKVAEAVLYKLVKGYEYDSEQVAIISDGSTIGSHWEKVPIKKVIEPNLRAVEYFLNNKKPRKKYPDDGYGEMLEVNGKMEYKVIPDDELEEKE
jgi:hypothetical protein